MYATLVSSFQAGPCRVSLIFPGGGFGWVVSDTFGLVFQLGASSIALCGDGGFHLGAFKFCLWTHLPGIFLKVLD